MRFLASYPEVSVGLVLTDRVTHFLDDQVDVALRAGDLPDSNLVAVKLGSIRRVVCGSPEYLDTRGEPIKPEDLALHSVISFESISASVQWSFWSEGEEIKASVLPRLSVNTIDAAIDAGLSGTGLVRATSYQVWLSMYGSSGCAPSCRNSSPSRSRFISSMTGNADCR